jgi:hypothetical protein
MKRVLYLQPLNGRPMPREGGSSVPDIGSVENKIIFFEKMLRE